MKTKLFLVSLLVVGLVGAVQVTKLTQDFEAATWPPSGWSIINGAGSYTWERNNSPWYHTGNGTYQAYLPVFLAYDYWYDEYMVSPALNFASPGLTSPKLTFYNFLYYYSSSVEDGELRWGTSPTGPWTTIVNWASSRNGITENIDLSPLLGQSTVHLAWHYYTPDYWYCYDWSFDNVLVTAESTGGGGGKGYDVGITDWFFDPQSDKIPRHGVDNFPVALLENYSEGATPGPVGVNCWIYDESNNEVYSSVSEVPVLASRAMDYAKFWDAWVPGSLYLIVFELDAATIPDDQNPTNNRWEEYIGTVITLDAAVNNRTLEPNEGDTLVAGQAITPKVGVQNNGAAGIKDLYVFFKPGSGSYSAESVLVASLLPSSNDVVTFPDWTPNNEGALPLLFYTALAGDEVPSNDSLVVNVTVALGVAENKPTKPATFGLTAISPNPFSTITTIRYQLPVNTTVALRAYDVSGNLVKTLVNGYTDAGMRTVVWDGRDNSGSLVPKGIYFVRMDAPEYSATQKLIFVR